MLVRVGGCSASILGSFLGNPSRKATPFAEAGVAVFFSRVCGPHFQISGPGYRRPRDMTTWGASKFVPASTHLPISWRNCGERRL